MGWVRRSVSEHLWARYRDAFLERRLRPATRRVYRQAITEFIEVCAPDARPIDSRTIAGWRQRLLKGGNAARTLNCKLAALRGFFDFLVG